MSNGVDDNIERVSKLAALGDRLVAGLKWIAKPLHALRTEKFWLISFLIVNILFFLVTLITPVADYVKRAATINETATEVLVKVEKARTVF